MKYEYKTPLGILWQITYWMPPKKNEILTLKYKITLRDLIFS